MENMVNAIGALSVARLIELVRYVQNYAVQHAARELTSITVLTGAWWAGNQSCMYKQAALKTRSRGHRGVYFSLKLRKPGPGHGAGYIDHVYNHSMSLSSI